jgi:Tfp pilus assembly protein PilX
MKTQPTLKRTEHQSGIVLIVALIMLAVIGLASVAIMRTALNTDIISDNNRVQSQAMQAAQAALRYCETQIQKANNPMTPLAATTTGIEAWETFGNWIRSPSAAQTDASAATQVPLDFVTSVDSGATARRSNRKLPRCMAQYRAVTGSTTGVIVVTARGFSDNYEADSAGHTQAGSVVWLQSIVTK